MGVCVPYKSDSIAINNPSLDRRVKLSQEARKEIVEKQGKVSKRQLARDYGVDRRTIDFILSPEKQTENLKRRAERGGWKYYYDSMSKDDHAKVQREHRRYKNDLYKKGLIGGNQ